MQKEEPVKNILRVARILTAMAEGQSRLTKIASSLQLSSSTVHRLLKSMETAGFAIQDPLSGGYFMGPLLCQLMHTPDTSHKILSLCSMEEMEKLRKQTGETVGLVVRLGMKRFLLEEVVSLQPVCYSVGKGYTSPLSAGASSRVLLAQLPEEKLVKILSLMDFPEITTLTITDAEKLRVRVEEAREQGYSMSFGEYLSGASSVAVPVYGHSEPASLCLLAPESRLNRETAEGLLPLMFECANRVKNNLEKYRQ